MWNIRALLRLNAQLVIDHYGPLFIVVSLFNLVIITALAVVILISRPVKVDAKKSNVVETATSYSGTFTAGFTKINKPFQRPNARVWKYEADYSTPNAATPKNTAILFIADNCASPAIFRPFFIRLAHDGYTVYTAEFYAKDMTWLGGIQDFSLFRRFAFCDKKLLYPEEYASYSARFTGNIAQQYKSLVDLAYPELSLRSSKDTIILAGDELALQALPLAVKQNSDLIDGSCNISSIENYSAGFGPVEQTDPLLALIIGKNRDSSLFMSAHTALALEKAVDSVITTKQVDETATVASETDLTTQTSATAPSATLATTTNAATPVVTKPTQMNVTTPNATAPTATKPTQTYTTAPAKTQPSQTNATVPAATQPTQTNATTPATTQSTQTDTTTPAGTQPTQTTTSTSTTQPAQTNASIPATTQSTQTTTTTGTTQPTQTNATTPATTQSTQTNTATSTSQSTQTDTTTTPAQQTEPSPTPEQSQ